MDCNRCQEWPLFTDTLCEDCWKEEALTEKGIKKILTGYEAIKEKADKISYSLFGHEPDEIEWPALDNPDGLVEVTWEQRACARGCCGYETMYKSFPLHYLWDEDWWEQAEAASKVEAEAKALAEQEKALATAKKKVERAQAQATTAQEQANAALRKAESELIQAGGMVATGSAA